jgi:hypothetical protein
MMLEKMRLTITALVCTTGPGLGLGCIDDDVERLGVDGLGERIVVVLSATAGLAWGEVP